MDDHFAAPESHSGRPFRRSGAWPTVLALLGALALSACGDPAPPPAHSAAAPATQAPQDEPAPGGGIAGDGRPDAGPKLRRVARFGSSRADRGDLVLSYEETRDETFLEFQQVFQEERLFEAVIDELNVSLILPQDVAVRFAECGDANAFYDPEETAVTLCYELMTYFVDMFGTQLEAETDEEWEEVGAKAVAALVFVFYHELGHALIHVLDLPVTGREEDAVDQLATVMLLESWEGEDSELAILSSAEWFGIDAGQSEELDMADEHSLDDQRYYNLVCWIYGSDTEYFSEVATEWELPEARAERCEEEYARMSASWDRLLGRHLHADS